MHYSLLFPNHPLFDPQLDDVILTQCFEADPPPPDPTPTDCVDNAFATTIPTRKVKPSKTFRCARPGGWMDG